MKNLIKKILKWFLHEHDNEVLYRIITYCETPDVKKGWKEDVWLEMTWYMKCKTCNKNSTQHFKSILPYPNKVK